MNKNSNPLDYLIWCCENNFQPSSFDILNAKDELKRLRNTEEFNVVCWARINSRGDLYDPRLMLNPHINQDTILPLYCNRKEFTEKYGKLSK